MVCCGFDYFGADELGRDDATPYLVDVRADRGVIKRGMSGSAVEYVQALAGALVDGQFGPATEEAVKKFQTKNGLPSDGVVGPQTLAALDKLSGGGSAGVQKMNLSDAPEPSGSTTPRPGPGSRPITPGKILAERYEAPATPVGTYAAAMGLVALAAIGGGYAIWGR